jgi:hypothetical protein
MATIVLQAAGAFVGSFFGPVGSAIGSAVGSMAGYMLDRSLINSTVHHRGAAARRNAAVRSGGGCWHSTRLWRDAHWRDGDLGDAVRGAPQIAPKRASRAGQRRPPTRYFGNAAFALCEGPIAGVRRIWADGKEVDRTQVDIRIHTGGPDQMPDELIVARQGEGNAPAYRGVAYAVVERLALEEFGNRMPQFQFEVLRPVGDFCSRLKAVTLIPGATERGLATQPADIALSDAASDQGREPACAVWRERSSTLRWTNWRCCARTLSMWRLWSAGLATT